MNRLGIRPTALAGVMRQLSALHKVAKPVVLMTHFAEAEQADFSFTNRQIKLFHACASPFNLPLSLANSAGIINHSRHLFDWVRPGIMLYGSTSIPGKTAIDLGLKAAMTLSARVIHINHIETSESVGYNRRFIASRPSIIAIISIGYGDGYPRNAPSGTPVMINKDIYPLVGRVSMDLISVDITHNPKVSIGDRVILWNHRLPIARIAESVGTSSYELMCRMTANHRMQRVYQHAQVPSLNRVHDA